MALHIVARFNDFSNYGSYEPFTDDGHQIDLAGDPYSSSGLDVQAPLSLSASRWAFSSRFLFR
jgi:hypothetical protein